MEENIIKITINKETIELLPNSPDLKQLIYLITKQKDNFDFNKIEVNCPNESFDKEGFKEILIDSIVLFRNNLNLEELAKESDLEKLKSKKR